MESSHIRRWMQGKQKGRKVWIKNIAFSETSQITSAFEKELIAVIQDIKFRNVSSDFQTTLQGDIRLVQNSKKTVTFADKTSSIYRLTKNEHNMLLRNAFTSICKKANTKIKDKINKREKEIWKNKEALHRLDINEESNYFFTQRLSKELPTQHNSQIN